MIKRPLFYIVNSLFPSLLLVCLIFWFFFAINPFVNQGDAFYFFQYWDPTKYYFGFRSLIEFFKDLGQYLSLPSGFFGLISKILRTNLNDINLDDLKNNLIYAFDQIENNFSNFNGDFGNNFTNIVKGVLNLIATAFYLLVTSFIYVLGVSLPQFVFSLILWIFDILYLFAKLVAGYYNTPLSSSPLWIDVPRYIITF